MRYLLLHMARAAWSLRWRLVASSLFAAVGFGVFAGAYSAIDSLYSTVAAMEARTNAADFEIRFALIGQPSLPPLDGVPGVLAVEARLMAPGRVRLGGGQQVAALAIASDPDRPDALNRLWLVAGAWPAPGVEGVVLERACAAHHKVSVGDHVALTLGTRVTRLRVSGIGGSSEFPVEPINPNNFAPGKGSLCVLFARLDLVQQRVHAPAVNSLLFRLRPGTDLAAFRRALMDRVAGRLEVRYAAARGERISYRFLDLYLGVLAGFLPTVVLVLAALALVLIFFTLLRWVVGQRPVIGLFMGMGYASGRIALGTLVPALAIMVLACGAGIGVAWLTLEGFGGNYARALGMMSPELALVPAHLALASAGTIAVVALAALAPTAWLLRLTPIAALRPGPSGVAEGGVGGARALGGPFWLRHAGRNLVRGPLIASLTVAAVALCLGVAIGFSVTLTSFERTAVGGYERARYGAIVDFTAPRDAEFIARIEAAAPGRWTPFVRGMAQLRHGARGTDVLVLGWDPASRVRTLRFTAGRKLRVSDRAAVIVERKLAAAQGLAVGQRVTIVAAGRPHRAELVGIFSGPVPNEIQLPLSFARDVFGIGGRSTGLFRLGRPISAEMKAALYRIPGVASVMSTTDMIRAIAEGIQPVRIILDLGSALAVAVALLFVFASVSYTLMARRGEYGILRIVGFADGRLILSMLSEVMALGAAAAALSVPVGLGVGAYFNARLSAAFIPIDTLPVAGDFAWVLVPALVLMPLAAAFPMGSILRAPLPAFLNERQFG